MQFRGGVLLLTLLLIVGINVSNKPRQIVKENTKEQIRKEFAIYKQNADTKEYDITNDNEFPEIGYLLNEAKTKCYGYNKEEIETKPIQELTNGVINGRVTIESSKTIYCEIYFDIDNKVPEINTFKITGKTRTGEELKNGYTYEYQDLPYQLEYIDEDVAQYCLSNNETCTEWNEIDTSTNKITIDSEDGTKTIYAYIKDKANNVSKVSQETITVDRTKPVVTTFTLTGTADIGQQLSNPSTYTHKPNITYNATITEANMEGYCIYEGSNSCSYNNNTTITNQSYTINDTEGSHSVTIKIKDKAGNESVVDTNSTKTITLDLQNPTATISPKSVTTESITVTVGYTGNDISGIVQRQCKINNQNNWKDAEPNGDCTINSLDDGTKLKDGQEYTIEGRVRDASGRKSTVVSQDIATKSNSAGKQILDKKPKGLSEKELGGMYRFVGQCDAANNGCDGIVDNFVCFGYETEDQCKSDIANNEYLYRIIGISSDGKLKLIKNRALDKEYMWWEDADREFKWERSLIYKAINGNDFLTSLSQDWQNKIATTVWLYGDVGSNIGFGPDLLSADELYKIETGQREAWSGYGTKYGHKVDKWTDKVIAKIGLLYFSDYYYSYNGEGMTICTGTDVNVCGNSWFLLQNNGTTRKQILEWTIVTTGRWDQTSYYVYLLDAYGFAFAQLPMNKHYVRPVFFLESSEVSVSEGTGRREDPFVIGGVN